MLKMQTFKKIFSVIRNLVQRTKEYAKKKIYFLDKTRIFWGAIGNMSDFY